MKGLGLRGLLRRPGSTIQGSEFKSLEFGLRAHSTADDSFFGGVYVVGAVLRVYDTCPD